MPCARFDVVYVAWPELSDALRRVLLPSLKVTVPTGVAVPGALTLTVAVKVTDCLRADGLREDFTLEVVLSLFTVWVRTGEVLPL